MAVDALMCERCGTKATYADAYVADLEQSCDGDIHEWIRPLDPDIDVVHG